MASVERCTVCGAVWVDALTCEASFHQMLAWELENQLYDVHHLLVLCYYLQHPHLYSQQALQGAMQLLMQFIEQGFSPQAMRTHIGGAVDSGVRTYKITGAEGAQGSYSVPVVWQMHVTDVARAGLTDYYANVRLWAQLTLKALRTSGNLALSAPQ